MIGILIVTHSSLAQEFIATAKLIVGPVHRAEAINIPAGSDIEQIRRTLKDALTKVGQDGDGTIIFTDMFGGTPTNISAEVLQPGQVEILAGINLPILLKCVSARESLQLDELVPMLQAYALKTVVRPADLLSRKG